MLFVKTINFVLSLCVVSRPICDISNLLGKKKKFNVRFTVKSSAQIQSKVYFLVLNYSSLIAHD